jgi:hypothetical protein
MLLLIADLLIADLLIADWKAALAAAKMLISLADRVNPVFSFRRRLFNQQSASTINNSYQSPQCDAVIC